MSINLPFELLVGLRYTRAGRKGRRKDRFMSFISAISIASIAVGVMALIVVLSVMNGFQKEVRDRMLSVLAHVEVFNPSGAIPDWKDLAKNLQRIDHIEATAPFVAGQGLLTSGRNVRGAMVRGISPEDEVHVSDLAKTAGPAALSTLTPGSFHVVLGNDLARLLRVRVGDKVTLVTPKGNTTPAGFIPRMKQLTVSATFHCGHYEFDSTMALVSLKDAAALYRTGGVTGLRVRLDDMQQAHRLSRTILRDLPGNLWVTDWTQQNKTWFAAVQVEKRMMAIILFLIVLVGAFGLVSTLVMTVTEKQSDIAILRTLGASPGSILRIFIIQGAVVGFIGVAVGVALGLGIACNLDVIVPTVESILGVEFLPREIYFISNMPSDPQAADIIAISSFSFAMSLIATIYPAWRAAKTHPAEALRHE